MKKLALALPIIVYVVASVLANLDLFPQDFMQYWWFDDVMHVLVFGTVALSLMYLAQRHLARWYLGAIATLALATLDELSQLFIAARAFTAQDLFMSVVGIVVATVLYWLVRRVFVQRVNDR